MNFWKSLFNVNSTILLLSTLVLLYIGAQFINPSSAVETWLFISIECLLLLVWVLETNKHMNKYFVWEENKKRA
jgi:hypothetical protein